MTYLSPSQFPEAMPDASPTMRLRVSRAAAWGADILTVLGAAVRVAQAVESRRDPTHADLKAIGIDGPLPKVA